MTSIQVINGGLLFLSRRLAVCLTLVMLLASWATRADAAFIGLYALGNFTLTNTNADGFVTVNPDGSLRITGGNDGSSIPGITDFSIIAPASGTVSFDYLYSSLDSPGFDFGGYFVNSFTMLANTDGQSGSASFAITQGQRFAFRVSTLDNTGEPGVLTISRFDAPAVNDIPEPSSLILAGFGLAGLALMRRRASAGCKLKSGGSE